MAIILTQSIEKNKLWLVTVYHLYLKIIRKLGERFVKLVASRNPYITLHDRNIVIVVKGNTDDVLDDIYDAIEEVEREMGLENIILPIVLNEKDPKIKEYEEYFNSSIDLNWEDIISKFKKVIRKKLGERFVKLVASRNPYITLHDRNIVIVVKGNTDDVLDDIYDAIEEVEREMGLENIILPIVLNEKDPKIKEYEEAFRHEWI